MSDSAGLSDTNTGLNMIHIIMLGITNMSSKHIGQCDLSQNVLHRTQSDNVLYQSVVVLRC